MKKHIIFTLAFLTSYCAKSQMLITDDTTTQDLSVHPSAILELRSNNKGLLVPGINMSTTTLQNPIESQLIYDTDSQRLMNYAASTPG